jgi:hypothetical protein
MRRTCCLNLSYALALVYVGLFGCSCDRTAGKESELSTASPHGVYLVRLAVKGEPPGARPGERYRKTIKLEAVKEGKLVAADDVFFSEEQYDVSFAEAYPVREWVSETVLRLGDNTSSQPFADEVVVSNHTGQPLRFLSLHYGKYERFLVFDLDAGAVLKLRASPQFNREWPASSVFYRAYTNGGELRGNAGGANRGEATDRPLTVAVDIK